MSMTALSYSDVPRRDKENDVGWGAVVTKHFPTPEERDERVIVPEHAEVAIPAFLAVDPASEPDEPTEDAAASD